MSTNARISDGTTWSHVQYDGYPEHMVPQLEAILASKGEFGVDILLGSDWSVIDSTQQPADDNGLVEGEPGIGLRYTDRPKLSNAAVCQGYANHVYVIDRRTMTVVPV